MEFVIAGFQFDMLELAGEPCAERVHAFAARREQPGHRILREPVDMEVRPQFPQFPSDGDVSARMPQADGR